ARVRCGARDGDTAPRDDAPASAHDDVRRSARATDRDRSGARPWWPAAITALAAGLALYFAFDARHLRGELALEREVTALLQQPNVVVGFALAGTGSAAGAYGNVALDM